MHKQHPKQDSSTEQTSPNTEQASLKQIRFLGFLMILIGPLLLAIGFTNGVGEVPIMGIYLTPPFSNIAICGLAIICFVIGIMFVRSKRS